MKSKKLIIIIALLQTIASFAQNSFIYIDDKPDYQRPMGMVETDDAYVILNQYYYAGSGNQDFCYFSKLDKLGHKLKEVKIERPDFASNAPVFTSKSILKLPDDNIAIIGNYNSTDHPRQFDVYYAVYDQDLNKISDTHFPKPYCELVPFSTMINSKNNIILCGYIMPNPELGINNYSFIMEFTTSGELLHEYYDRTVSFPGAMYHVMEEADGSYLAVQQATTAFEGASASTAFCRFNSDLSLKKAYLDPGPFVFDMARNGYIIPKNDTSFLMVGRALIDSEHASPEYPIGTYLNIATFDTTCQLLDFHLVSDTSTENKYNACIWKTADIDKTNSEAFFLSSFASAGLPNLFVDMPSTIWTHKYTTDGQEQWLRKYGGADTAAYFFAFATYATTDGGVLLLNTRHAYGSGQDSDVHIVKYDKNGYLPVEEVELPLKPQISCYPNPATAQLHIDLPAYTGQVYHLRILDICGKSMIEKTINSAQNTIDVSPLSAGVYTYILSHGNTVSTRGKWIKR